MGLIDISKKKEERKEQGECAQCFRPIAGSVYTIDNNNYIGIELQSPREYLATLNHPHNECADNQHHFTDLKHFDGGSTCKCQKCGLVVGFNRGWPDRIEPAEWNAFTQKYKGSKIDFYYPSKEDIVQSLELLAIKYNGYDSYISLCIHKITHEAYITETENTFQGDIQRGGRVNSKIISVSKASLEDVATIVNFECDYTTFHNEQNSNILQTSHKKLLIDGKPYRIEWFVVVDDVEISMNEIFSNEKVFDVPAQCLTKEQHTKYAEYYHRPGPYEHYFMLPAECCQKLIRKLIPLEF